MTSLQPPYKLRLVTLKLESNLTRDRDELKAMPVCSARQNTRIDGL